MFFIEWCYIVGEYPNEEDLTIFKCVFFAVKCTVI